MKSKVTIERVSYGKKGYEVVVDLGKGANHVVVFWSKKKSEAEQYVANTDLKAAAKSKLKKG